MSTAKVVFKKCIQDSQEYGSDDEHMVSRVFFDLSVKNIKFENLYSDIKQTVGSNYESAPLEIGMPQDYIGPFNYEAFRDAAENYYRSLLGGAGTDIRIQQSGSNIRMHNNTFAREYSVEFDIDTSEGGW
ncbi:MAG: hypothetical protein ABIJ37_08625 [Pseudomonadota bacterium]